MPSDLLALQTGFSGVQLIAMVYILVEQRHSTAAHQKQGAQIDRLNQRLANVMGRLRLSTEDEDK